MPSTPSDDPGALIRSRALELLEDDAAGARGWLDGARLLEIEARWRNPE